MKRTLHCDEPGCAGLTSRKKKADMLLCMCIFSAQSRITRSCHNLFGSEVTEPFTPHKHWQQSVRLWWNMHASCSESYMDCSAKDSHMRKGFLSLLKRVVYYCLFQLKITTGWKMVMIYRHVEQRIAHGWSCFTATICSLKNSLLMPLRWRH